MADTKEIIQCPACHKDMHKIFISKLGINIDVCLDGCGGIYFDNREFKHFDEKNENIDEILKEIKGKDFESVDTNEIRICPVCGTKMVKNYSSMKKAVEVDECYSCGGKFLDNGELQKIRSEYDSDSQRSADFNNYLIDYLANKGND